MNNQLIQQHRGLLDAILDQLIPANTEKNIPSAGSIGVADFIAARAIDDEEASTAIKELLSSVASVGGDVTPAMIQELEQRQAENFTVLLNLTYMGYYSRPDIRACIGLGSWPVHPKGYEVPAEPAEVIEGLTAPVTKRGRFYRDPADDQKVTS